MRYTNKKIAVVTPDLEKTGGVTQCAIATISALNERNIIPDVFAISGDKNEVYKKFGKRLLYNFKKIHAPKRLALYGMLIKNFQIKNKDYDYIYDFSNLPPFNKDKCFSYILFPEYIIEERGKYNRGLWALYYFPKRIFMNPLIKRLFKKSKIDFACLSEFTNNRIFETIKRRFTLIYPPVKIKEFMSKNSKRDKEVISTGGITGEKNQLMQLKIAAHIPNIKFQICGSSKRNPSYFNKVLAESKKLKNVSINPDIAFNDLKKKLQKSLIFIHTSENEPFGISTVESIAAGCIPVVHNSGGQKEIVPFKELRFDNEDEASQIIKAILKWDDKKIRGYRTRLQKHIEKFDIEIFKSKLINYLK